LLAQLAEVQQLIGTTYKPILSGHNDELKPASRAGANTAKPEDYLDSFGRFVREQINQSAALAVSSTAPVT
jgi:type I restriction enzyme R subunit